MKCLERNKRPFYYALYLGDAPAENQAGQRTGETVITYGNPVLMAANVSPATGQTNIEQFGNELDYDRVIVTDDLSCPIDEHSVLWVDCQPVLTVPAPAGQTGTVEVPQPFDYVVKKIARSLNSISIAIARVRS